MFQFCRLAVMTALFMGTSASLMAMEEEKGTLSVLSPIINQKNEQLEDHIYEIISQQSHVIEPKELKKLTEQYFSVQMKYLARQSMNILQLVFRKDNLHPITTNQSDYNHSLVLDDFSSSFKKFEDLDLFPNFEETLTTQLQMETFNNLSKRDWSRIFKNSKLMQDVVSEIFKKYSDLLLEWKEAKVNQKDFLKKTYAHFYAKNPFYLKSFLSDLQDPVFFKKSFEVFFIERLSFDNVKRLYDLKEIGSNTTTRFLTCGFLHYIFPFLYPKGESIIANTIMKKKLERKDIFSMLKFFEEDEEKKPLPLTYFITTHDLSKYVDDLSSDHFTTAIVGNDKAAHITRGTTVVERALNIAENKNLFLHSLPLLAMASRTLSLFHPTTVSVNKRTNNFKKQVFMHRSNFSSSKIVSLHQELVNELCAHSLKNNTVNPLFLKKQKILMSALQNAILLLGNMGDLNESNNYSKTINLLSSVTYNPDKIFGLEKASNSSIEDFRRLEIIRTISLYMIKSHASALIKDLNEKNKFLEENLLTLEEFITHCEIFKENKKEKYTELLELLSGSSARILLKKKSQLVEKHKLLTKLGRAKEANKVFQELLEKQAFWKERAEANKKNHPQKTSNTGKIVLRLLELEKREREKLEARRKKKELQKEKKQSPKQENEKAVNTPPLKQEVKRKN